jgi:hypothetical protein
MGDTCGRVNYRLQACGHASQVTNGKEYSKQKPFFIELGQEMPNIGKGYEGKEHIC